MLLHLIYVIAAAIITLIVLGCTVFLPITAGIAFYQAKREFYKQNKLH